MRILVAISNSDTSHPPLLMRSYTEGIPFGSPQEKCLMLYCVSVCASVSVLCVMFDVCLSRTMPDVLRVFVCASVRVLPVMFEVCCMCV